jgi:TfoX/Sxy family transcriptional regulator of competence genes
MAYDEELANRIRTEVQDVDNVTEMRMFGGLAFLVGGNMAVAASGQGGLMLRADPDQSEELASRPHAGRMVMRGKEMNGWLRVDSAGIESDDDLARWVDIGVRYASSLPPKKR